MSGHIVTRDDGLGCPHERNPGCGTVGCHPVVVIDPEDALSVERLRTALSRQPMTQNVAYTALQAALRSLIAPPKPPEPTGLGAVVEDAKGERWVRRGLGPWVAEKKTGFAEYTDIDAVKVLSEGVTA